MGSPSPQYDRRSSDRRSEATNSIEAIAQRATIGAPTVYRIFSGIGSVASTLLLAIIGMLWQEVRGEWRELKAQITEIRHELDRQPSPEEFQKVRDKVDVINDRLIRLEAKINE